MSFINSYLVESPSATTRRGAFISDGMKKYKERIFFFPFFFRYLGMSATVGTGIGVGTGVGTGVGSGATEPIVSTS